MPKLSIITINYNNSIGLKDTVRSVLSQTSKDFEFIIIDGGSNDDSTKIIEENKSHFTYVVSEKDAGIYDAMNKGILKSTGDYCLFLNSGDTFYNSSVVEWFNNYLYNSKNEYEIIYGDSFQTGIEQPFLYKQDFTLNYDFWYLKTLNHQAVFIKRELFDEFGLYDTQYKIAADFDFFLKVYAKKPNVFNYTDTVICNYDFTGTSSNPKTQQLHQLEKDMILQNNLPQSVYKSIRKNYRKKLPFKERLLDFIHDNKLLKSIYYLTYKRLK